MVRAVMTAAPLLMLTACGFQIRGTTEFPQEMSVVYIDTHDRYSPFYRELTTTLGKAGLTLSRDPTVADTLLRISRDETGQRVLSVSARNVATEYDVFYTIDYSVYMNGTEVLPSQRLTRTRDYTYDVTDVLGKAMEEEMLRDSLAADLVVLVTRRMGAIH